MPSMAVGGTNARGSFLGMDLGLVVSVDALDAVREQSTVAARVPGVAM